ncbi:MAG: 2,3-bisphosphoglycerate-independent phosphoglycerate mutase [Deltaproteobacteria bacterium]|nr:2,3-bisphosphoglycerate-independent phosphoglycerate mutase [Myxococcales bacterium]MDP3215985.1 2,3-bisphosphoglycerate-independent phosphoglycerate mutase [Deltaproteobacteria bacterium]
MSVLNLRRSPKAHGVDGPVVVVVMDGVGVGAEDEGNAVWLARTPVLDALGRTVPTRQLRAHGLAVGLPSDDDMGNSEVGHNALGAGRVFEQGARLVNQAIASEAMFRAETWRWLIDGARERGAPVHFIGLLSDGNVHSHVEHLYAMIRRCHLEGVQSVRVHALLDGRDVPETSALTYVDALEAFLRGFTGRDYRVASGGGRMKVTMDRYEADWSMVARGWEAHVHGEGRGYRSLSEAVSSLRAETPGVIDQNLPGFVIVDERGAPVGPIRDGASVIFFNFRGDRAIEITRAFEQETLTTFDRGPRPEVRYAGMMQYDGDLRLPRRYLVTPPAIDRTLGEYLASEGVMQLAISETQKFGHVTYFWNGNRTEPFDPQREVYVEVSSDLRPFEERPWMKCAEITDRLIDELKTGRYRHARVNYPNGDMVGHTGVRDAAVMAVEAVDLQLGRLIPAVLALGGAVLVTADHGNADEMFELDKKTKRALTHADGRPRAKTSHTLNPVPLHVVTPPGRAVALRGDLPAAGLSNVAATVLDLLGYSAPEGYDPSLLAE